MAQVSVSPPRPALPRPIERALGQVDRRIRGTWALRGLGTSALVSAVVAAGFMAVDFVWGLPGPARWVAWNVWVLATGAGLLATLARALARGPRAVDLAAVVERGDARLGDVLTAAVDLARHQGAAYGSPALIAALTDDASARAQGIDPARIVPSGPATRRFALGMAMAALVALPCVVWDDPFGVLARRLLTPWAQIDRVGRYVVAVAPGNTHVAIGDDLIVTARVSSRLGGSAPTGGATLEWTDAETGRTHRSAMEAIEASALGAEASPERMVPAPDLTHAAPAGSRFFRAALPKPRGAVVYRVASTAGESGRYRVEAIPAPAIVTLSARVEPPAYTKLPTVDLHDPARLDAWEDSKVTLTLTANNCLWQAEVLWPPVVKPDAASSAKPTPRRLRMEVTGDGHSATATLPADASGEYAINLVDRHELRSRPEPARRIVVKPDAPPVVAVKGMDGLEQSRADDVLRVAVAARDDMAVASVELHYAIERFADARPSTNLMDEPAKPPATEQGKVPASPEGLGAGAFRGDVTLGLKGLALKPDDVLLYRVRVADNRPAPRGPNVVWSAPRRLAIATNAAPLWARRSEADRETIKAKLDALKKAAAENRRETEQLRYAADAVLRGNGEWDRDRQQSLAKREADARVLGEDLGELARSLTEDPVFRPMARPAQQIAEVEAEAARATLDQARQQDDPAKRLGELRLADARMGAVSGRLDELQRQFDALAERDADRKHLQDLADRQALVAEHAEAAAPPNPAAAPPDRAALDQLEAEQNRVRNDLEALLKKSPDLRADLLEAHLQEAEALAKLARAIAARQRDQARNAADLARKAAELKALAEDQRAIENDARRLALDVDNPLAENGRGRLNVDPLRQAAEPIERGDIPQGKQALIGAENELRRLARDLDDVPGDLKALARRLAARQDQLANETLEALAEKRGKTAVPDAEKPAFAKALAPLAKRQEALARLTRAILDTDEAKSDRDRPRFPRDAANQAAEAAKHAAETTGKHADPRAVEQRVNEARNALHKLANAIPDHWQRDAKVRQKLADARRMSDETARNVERHVRETEPLRAKDPAKAAAELASRLGALAEKAREASRKLDEAAPDVPSRVEPQRGRAARRALALARAIDLARKPAANDHDHEHDRARRDALAAAATDVLAANDRVDQKLNGQAPADDLADELLADQNALTAGPPSEPPASVQRRLASALRALPAPDAPLEQAEAVRQAERAAAALAALEARPPASPEAAARARAEAVRPALASAKALADRLASRDTPRARLETLAHAERALNDPDPAVAPDAAEAALRQRAAAAELARLESKNADLLNQARHAVDEAEDVAERVRRPDESIPGRGKPDSAARRDANTRAADALEALAATLPGAPPTAPPVPSHKPPADPDLALNADHAAKAHDLAQRERRLRERLQAILADKVAPQQEIRRESIQVGQALADLRDRTRELSPRAFGPANEAAAHLGEHAPRAMDEAANQLAQGAPAPARDAQRRASEAAERGAQSAEDLAEALRAEAQAQAVANGAGEGEGEEPKHQAEPSPIGQAREAMASATKQLGQARDPQAEAKAQALQAAKAAMRTAAQRLQAAAESQNKGPSQPALAQAKDAPAHDPKGGKAGVAQADTLATLQDLIRKKTGRSWGELPGHLRTELLQMSQGRYRDDYARLIQLYFREIAAGAEDTP